MSAFGTQRTSQPRHLMSAFGGKADISELEGKITHVFKMPYAPLRPSGFSS